MSTKNRRLASQMMNPMEISLADEVRKTLQAECYGAALALSLTIPDAYGQIAFPEEKKVGKRYMDWYRQYCGYALSSRMGKDPMPAFDALACYKLRCELLHNGDANMETKYLYELDDQGRLMRNDVNLEHVSFSLRGNMTTRKTRSTASSYPSRNCVLRYVMPPTDSTGIQKRNADLNCDRG